MFVYVVISSTYISHTISCIFFFSGFLYHTDLHSFPTRRSSDLILVLKGSSTEIYVPNEPVSYRNPGGNPGMATGGMGDTLAGMIAGLAGQDRKSTRLNSSHVSISYAVFCLKKKKKKKRQQVQTN